MNKIELFVPSLWVLLLLNPLLFAFIALDQSSFSPSSVAVVGVVVAGFAVISFMKYRKRSISWDSLPSFINLHGCTLDHGEKLELTLEIKNGVVSNVHIEVKDGSFIQKMRREIRAER